MVDETNRTELLALREEVALLRAKLAEAHAGMMENLETRRAALNLMEDAVAARREAEAASSAKDEFLAIIGHELRTPLTAIVLWTRALRADASPETIVHAVTAIEQSAECQARLIDDLLDLSRLASGHLALARRATDVDALVAAAIEAVRPLAAAKQIALTDEVEPNLGVAVLDGTRVTQVVWNLLTNAIKFTPDKGNVRVRVRKVGGALEIVIADDGEGISPEFLPHVFEKFRQADMGTNREHMGLGIGLTLAKDLIELHGGTIDAESAGLGHGARFTVKVPWIAARSVQVTQTGQRYAVPALEQVRVLLVEDDPGTRSAMKWTLERAGAVVSAVGNANDALARLDQSDVLVSDLGLPDVSGIELVARVAESCRERGARPPPACAISAHTRDVDRRSAIDAGFDMFLPKPVAPDHLIEAVADLRAML